jgi:hypothetical protein
MQVQIINNLWVAVGEILLVPDELNNTIFEIDIADLNMVEYVFNPLTAPNYTQNDFTLNANSSATRLLIKNNINAAVGIKHSLFTTAQVRSILALLLYERDALTTDGKLKPISEWSQTNL